MNFLKTAFCAIAMSSVATMGLAEMVKVSEIDVDVDLAAVAEADALTYWPEIGDDLEKAIAARVQAGKVEDEEAYRVDISINEIKLDDLYILPNNGEFNRLEGVVAVYQNKMIGDGGSGAAEDSYAVRLEAFRNDQPIPEGWTRVPADEGDYYRALIDAFAEKVANRLLSL